MKPILFSGSMVRAILDGSKTQTRRIQKIRTDSCGDPIMPGDTRLPCPYGKPGDRLWVRESMFAKNLDFGGELGLTEPLTKLDRNRGDVSAFYSADGEPAVEEQGFNLVWLWKRNNLPSIYMPRSFSRITLEVVSVRVERVQDISDEDAIAEGIDACRSMDVFYHRGMLATSRVREESGIPADAPYGPRSWYAQLWESINGFGSWEANPWVWVVEFRRVEP